MVLTIRRNFNLYNLLNPVCLNGPRDQYRQEIGQLRAAFHLYCSSLPLSRSLDSSPPRCFNLLHSQIPPLLPLTFFSTLGFTQSLQLISKLPFSSSTNSNSEEEEDSEEENSSDEGSFGKRENSDEVDRVCKVVEELFTSDRNLEAVLDKMLVKLSTNLVIQVLERNRHAHKPASRFFHWAATRPGFLHDSETYNKFLSILGKTRQFESMVLLLEEMGSKGVLTLEAFKISVKAFAAGREMKKAVGIFQLMKKYGFKADLEMFNGLLDALVKAKLAKEARELFDKLKDQYMPDLRTYTVLLFGWCKVKNLVKAGKVWNDMLDSGLQPDIAAHNVMLEGLIRGQRRPEAVKLFEMMKAKGPQPAARTYRIILQSFCKSGKMDDAVRCFDEMVCSGCQPDAATYTCLIVGFGNAKQMHKVSELLSEMREKGCPPDARTYNALIKLMANRNMQEDAARIYKQMIKNGFEPTIHTYNMMMKSHFHGSNYELGCAMWEEMYKKGICPDVNSYTVFIGGHIRHGRPQVACKYIEEMINKGMNAPQIDYNKFAADFSRAGRPDVLYELGQKMNFTGKFEASNVFNRWAERMKKRVKIRLPNQTGERLF